MTNLLIRSPRAAASLDEPPHVVPQHQEGRADLLETPPPQPATPAADHPRRHLGSRRADVRKVLRSYRVLRGVDHGPSPQLSGRMITIRATLAADFAVNDSRSSRLTLLAFRLEQARVRRALPRVAGPLVKALYLGWVEGVVGAELPGGVDAGPGLRLPHAGRGVILHPNTRIGAGVTVYHRVTVGMANGNPKDVPTIGDNVYLGTSASVLGAVSVGDQARVGAGAVVVHDVPPAVTAVGVPARAVSTPVTR